MHPLELTLNPHNCIPFSINRASNPRNSRYCSTVENDETGMPVDAGLTLLGESGLSLPYLMRLLGDTGYCLRLGRLEFLVDRIACAW